MKYWFYQLRHSEFPIETFRYDIAEQRFWKWYLLTVEYVPIREGRLTIVNDDGTETIRNLTERVPLWRPKRTHPHNPIIQQGDEIVFYYGKEGLSEEQRGFCGAATIERWDADEMALYFCPCRPTNELKMRPWGDARAREIANSIRLPKRGTLWEMSEKQFTSIREGINGWLAPQMVEFRTW